MASENSHTRTQSIFSPSSPSHLCPTTSSTTIKSGQEASSTGRSSSFTVQESTGTSAGLQCGVLLTPLHSAEKIRRLSSSNRFEEAQYVHPLSAFQNGVGHFHQSSTERGRMDNQCGFFRCLPSYSCRPQIQEVSSPTHYRRNSPVQGNVFWSECGTKDLYETHGTSGSSTKIQGHPSTSLPGRLAVSRSIASGSPASHQPGNTTISEVRHISQFGEVGSNSQDKIHLPRDGYRLESSMDQANRRRDPEDPYSGVFASKITISSGTPSAVFDRPPQPCITIHPSGSASHTPDPVLCQVEGSRPEEQYQQLSSPGQTLSQGNPVVEELQSTQGRSSSPSTTSRPHPDNRCQPTGMGSLLRRSQSVRFVVRERESSPHLYSGVESCQIGASSFGNFSPQQGDSATIRQHFSSGLYTQPRGDPLHLPVHGSKGPSPVVLRQQNSPSAFLSAGSSEHHCGSSVSQQSSVVNRVDSTQGSLSQDSSVSSCARCRPFCYTSKPSITEVCVSVSRSDSMENRCILSGVGRHGPICVSPNETNPRDPEEVGQVTNSALSSGTLLAQPILVSRTSPVVVRSSSETSSVETSVTTTSARVVPLESFSA